jgi:hypothetical protein
VQCDCILKVHTSRLTSHTLSFTPRRFYLRIADLTIELGGDDRELKLGVVGPTKKFLVEDCEPDVSVTASWADPSIETSGEKIFDSGGVWQLYRSETDFCFRFASPAVGPLPYKTAQFNSDFSSGKVFLNRSYLDSALPIYPLEYPLDELLMLNLLARGRGVEVHACGLMDAQGKGHLFLGQSGAGKTTMATLWQNAEDTQILSDDRIILRQLGGQLWMYGTPWHGEAELAHPSRAPVTRIYFLRHGEENQLLELKGAEAVGRFFSCSFPLFYRRDALDFMLGFFEKVAMAVPCYELGFFPKEHVVGFLLGST